MSKRIPILIVVVVLILLAAPYAVGMFTESRLSERIEAYDANPSLSAAVDSYERGWRSSRVVLHIGPSQSYMQTLGQLNPAAVMLQNLSVPIVVEVEHGPVLLGDGFGLGTASVKAYIDPDWQVAQMAEQFLGIPYLFELRGQSGFGTGFDFEGEIPPFDGAFADASYRFSGLEFTGRLNGPEIQIDAVLANAALQSSEISALIEALSISGDYVYAPDRLPIGASTVSVVRMSATNPIAGADPVFLASNLAAESSITEDDNAISIGMVYSADRLLIENVVALADVALGMSLSDVDAEAVHRYYTLMSDPNATANPAALQAELMPLLDTIVAGSPELSLEPIRFSMPSGNLDGQLTVSVDNSALPSGSATDLQNLAVLMGALDAELTLTASKALAQELAVIPLRQQVMIRALQSGQTLAPEQLDAMAAAQAGLLLSTIAAQGILVDNGDTYSTLIELHDGNPTANGQPLPLGAF